VYRCSDDGRWIAEAIELPCVMCYGQTRGEALSNAERLAIEVIADRIALGRAHIVCFRCSLHYSR
jgi:predicted RNase H-like HicB family nuclease